jgi:hypothetical protein
MIDMVVEVNLGWHRTCAREENRHDRHRKALHQNRDAHRLNSAVLFSKKITVFSTIVALSICVLLLCVVSAFDCGLNKCFLVLDAFASSTPSLASSSTVNSSLSPAAGAGAGSNAVSSRDPTKSLQPGDVRLDITSPLAINGTTGQFVKLTATVTNLQTIPLGGLAYISIVDTVNKVPIDLEDWSASKGLYLQSILPGQSLPLEWNIRLVKAGNYTVVILFNKETSGGETPSPPAASTNVILNVASRSNLNPGNILPVAFGTPAVLVAALGLLNYRRGRHVGTY